jgi:acyl carrier protein
MHFASIAIMNTAGRKQEIETILWKYIRDNFLPRHAEAKLGSAENLFDCGILDSAGLISFIVYLEKKFGLTIPDEELLPENFASLEAISSYLVRKKNNVGT